MKILFWLLDISYEVRNEIPEIWLWGVTTLGERALIIDRNFTTYFYVVLNENTDPNNMIDRINKKNLPCISRLETVEKRYFGKPVKTVKVHCKTPDVMPQYAKTIRNLEGVENCFEEDIRITMRYLIDNNIVPCCWHEVEATEYGDEVEARTDVVYIAKSYPRLLERTATPALRILGFSTICYSREGTPRPERNPVVIATVATNNGERRQFLATEDRNDRKLLEELISYTQKFDPDVVVGYGTAEQDWSYLRERCRKHGLRLTVDRTNTEPHTSVYGHVSLTGRANIDLSDYSNEFPEVKVKTLANLADYLGVMKIETRNMIEDIDFAEHWDNPQKRRLLQEFSTDNVNCIMGLASAILDFGLQLSSLVSLPLDHVGTAASGFRVEWFIIKRTHNLGELVPHRVEQAYLPYVGGLVLQPEPGLHENIVVLDFKSMYPNIMINYNLSPDTYVLPNEQVPASGIYEAPEVGHRFRKEPPGFYKEVLTYLIHVRDQTRPKMNRSKPGTQEYRVFDARQKALKIITNATYGYAGWTGARWYMKPVAEAAAAWGRQTILTAIEMARKEGLRVIYGDTDSIFLENEPVKIARLSKQIRENIDLEVKPDEAYVRILFTEAKKRYAGLMSDGRLDVAGMEVVRGDWATVAKKVQEKVLEIILKDKSPKKAADFVQKFVNDLRQRRVPYRELVIWKTLTKPPEEYEVKASHVEAARMLAAQGWKLSVGDKIGFVVTTGTGRLYERVKPHMFASYEQVDIEYYIAKQVVPAAARILAIFGITEEDLTRTAEERKESRKLSDFFGS